MMTKGVGLGNETQPPQWSNKETNQTPHVMEIMLFLCPFLAPKSSDYYLKVETQSNFKLGSHSLLSSTTLFFILPMEKTQKGKEKEGEVRSSRLRLVSSSTIYKPSITDVKLAGVAISLHLKLKSADMPVNMQEHALRYTRSLVDSAPPNSSHIARSLKKEFDSVYGPAWHCVVGKSFGSFVTHSPGGFIYFSHESLSFLLFKTEVRVILEPKSCVK